MANISDFVNLISEIKAIIGACEMYRETDKPTDAQFIVARAICYDLIKDQLDNFFKED